MKEKPAFMIYHRDMKALMKMTDKDLGALIKALYAVSLGEDPDPPKKHEIVFDMMAERVREDTQHYNDKIEQAKRAGRASADARQRGTDVNGRQRPTTDVNQYNTSQYNTTHSNNNNNPALNYSQRGDDLKDVMMDM